ncbi:hypothetical protein HYS47_05625 [Candidatus Woesearchaeota archaeon]|nr:hypothetical protein [Candidatus Woesearchaeota archaeon]
MSKQRRGRIITAAVSRPSPKGGKQMIQSGKLQPIPGPDGGSTREMFYTATMNVNPRDMVEWIEEEVGRRPGKVQARVIRRVPKR